MSICVANLIPIFITLLVCGFLFIYFNSRLAEVKSAVEKQNRVLTAFITNIQNDIMSANVIGANVIGAMGPARGGASQPPGAAHNLASPEAINAVKRVATDTTDVNEKIVVSEDEDESESESSDDSDEDVDENEDADDADDADVAEEDLRDSIKIIKLQDECDNVQPFVLQFESVVVVPDVDVSELSSKITDITDDEPLQEVNIESKTAEVEPKVADLEPKVDVSYEHTKVDDLRKIVSDKGLATKEEVKKLKKPELLSLLKPKTD
jgi:hypothetical protein